MKRALYFLAFMGMCSLLSAQSLTLTHEGNPVGNNDTINISISASNLNELNETYLIITNVTDDVVSLKVAKHAISLLANAEVEICLPPSCYPAEVDTTVIPFPLVGESSCGDRDFSIHYNPKGSQGISLIYFTVFNVDNPNDNTHFYIKYTSGTVGISDNKTTANNITAYPNPAADKVTIKYSLSKNAPAKLVVKNLMGVTLYSTPLNAGSDKVSIDVSQYASGIYFYSLLVDEQVVSTKKLLVR